MIKELIAKQVLCSVFEIYKIFHYSVLHSFVDKSVVIPVAYIEFQLLKRHITSAEQISKVTIR